MLARCIPLLAFRLGVPSLLLGLIPCAVAQNGYLATIGHQAHILDKDWKSLGFFYISATGNGIATDGTTVWTALCPGKVYAYDMSGTPLFSWSTGGCLQGLAYISANELALDQAASGLIVFRDPFTGISIRSIPNAEGGNKIEGIAYDGTYLWQLGSNGIYATDVNTGAILWTIPNPATGCTWAGTGLASSGPDELTIACLSGAWFKVTKSTGAITSSGYIGMAVYGLTGIPCDVLGTSYCTPAVPNSSGKPAVISAWCSDLADGGNFELRATDLPLDKFGYFLTSETQGFVANPGGSQGNLCLGGKIGRFAKQVQKSGNSGTITIQVDLTKLPMNPPHTVLAGETWNFQAWFRDSNPGSTSNFTDGVSVLFK